MTVKKVVRASTEVLLRRKHMVLLHERELLDNGASRSGYYLLDSRTGERTRTTRVKGERAIFEIGQLELF